MANKKNTYRKKKNGAKGAVTDVRQSFKLDLAFVEDKRFRVSAGLFILAFTAFLLLAMVSYIFTGRADQSVIESTGIGRLILSGREVQNWLGLTGALLAHFIIYTLFGLGSFLMLPILAAFGYQILMVKPLFDMKKVAPILLFAMFWISLLLGYFVYSAAEPSSWSYLCGGIGLSVAGIFDSLIGWGTMFFLVFSLGVFFIYYVRNPRIETWFGQKPSTVPAVANAANVSQTQQEEEDELEEEITDDPEALAALDNRSVSLVVNPPSQPPMKVGSDPTFTVENPTAAGNEKLPPPPLPSVPMPPGEQLVIEDFDFYDPKRDLSTYHFPPLELLKDAPETKVKVTHEELQANKDKIVETLNNFKIGITSIKATIGPTVTLYEIVPDPGVKISRIKSLEDDIALNLAALGIRIIAPIPGKGTIGIEVPNKNREMVSLRSILANERFQNSDKELPIVLGKTISNEVFITDLAKMPHLLMAGATGQGKSVGLNVILASLLYKKHPAELKFVLVDPKKVELSLFSTIERHFLASLPNADEAILTDTKKVVDVLNSLCVEMDIRYNLLKDAGCRNIKEYNDKFVRRRLNPQNGHRFLPYIVLVIDELADLMMTAGKEIEMPIARLAQLARAIGIHLIIATQRPSVDVITGLIKANFPARMSFKVSSKVDSRTILDTGGADQLVGMGDMLLSNGSDIIRLQCAYVDTEEIEKLCDFVGSQRGYDTSYQLPEFEDELGETKSIDLSSRDAMFEDAARLVVVHQLGSTSLVQRKLSLGYARAGRIIDQLEAAGIVGPYEGSKARQVLVDEFGLEQILNGLSNMR